MFERVIFALFVWLISHQPAVLFSQNKSAISTFLSEQISTSHQPPAKRTGCLSEELRKLLPQYRGSCQGIAAV
jgi:hypothetical protein